MLVESPDIQAIRSLKDVNKAEMIANKYKQD